MKQRFAIEPVVAAEDILEVAGNEGWNLLSVLDTTRPDASPQIMWTTADGAETVTYVEDDLLDLRYVQVDGSGENVWAALRSRGMVFTTAEVAGLAETAATPEELLAATCYVGVVAGETTDPDLLRCLQRALTDPHPQVRRVAVMAGAYAGWPELLPQLEQIEAADPDPEARELGGRVATSVRAGDTP